MYEFITKSFMGSTITLFVVGSTEGLTGEVIDGIDNIIGLRTSTGNKIYINANYIAYFF